MRHAMVRSTLSVDIGGTKLLMLAEGKGLAGPLTRRVATGPAATPTDIEAAIKAFIADNDLRPDALGIAVPGLVADRKVEISDVLPQLAGWQGLAGCDVPQLLVNDIRGALAQEATCHADNATVVVLICGTAVGSAYLSAGRVLRGSRGWAGEVGSMPMPTDHGVKRLDELAGGAAIVRRTGRSPDQVHAALAHGDPGVERVVHEAGVAFGLAIAALVNILNPDVVRVAGGTLGYRGYWDSAVVTAREHALPELREACTISRIEDAELVVARGAMRLAEAARHGHSWVEEYV
ncbi:ROK family protein [Streptomyces sp. NPDC054841]